MDMITAYAAPNGGLGLAAEVDDQESAERKARSEKGPKITAVIPAKNEANNISWVLGRLPATVGEVVLVDGDSTDGTVEIAKALRPDIVVAHQNRPGKGAALRAGFAASKGDIIVMLDADGSMDPREISRFIALLDSGFDLVKGSRFMLGAGSTDITTLRHLGNLGLMWLGNLLFRTTLSDLCYGYCAFHRRHLDALNLSADGFEIETELILRAISAGLRITEVPSIEAPRRAGQSNLRTFADGQRILRMMLSEFLRPRPKRAPGNRHRLVLLPQ